MVILQNKDARPDTMDSLAKINQELSSQGVLEDSCPSEARLYGGLLRDYERPSAYLSSLLGLYSRGHVLHGVTC